MLNRADALVGCSCARCICQLQCRVHFRIPRFSPRSMCPSIHTPLRRGFHVHRHSRWSAGALLGAHHGFSRRFAELSTDCVPRSDHDLPRYHSRYSPIPRYGLIGMLTQAMPVGKRKSLDLKTWLVYLYAKKNKKTFDKENPFLYHHHSFPASGTYDWLSGRVLGVLLGIRAADREPALITLLRPPSMAICKKINLEPQRERREKS